jgi:hypothetical protein
LIQPLLPLHKCAKSAAVESTIEPLHSVANTVAVESAAERLQSIANSATGGAAPTETFCSQL